MAVPALARQMQIAPFIIVIAIERYAQLAQPVDRIRCALNHEFHCLAIVQARACDHGIAHMVFKCVTGVQYSSNSALCPGSRASGERPLGQYQHPLMLCQSKRCGKSGRAGTNN